MVSLPSGALRPAGTISAAEPSQARTGSMPLAASSRPSGVLAKCSIHRSRRRRNFTAEDAEDAEEEEDRKGKKWQASTLFFCSLKWFILPPLPLRPLRPLR